MSCGGGWWEVKNARCREVENARCRKDGVLIVEWNAVVVYA